MLQISEKQIKNRLFLDNPWWKECSEESFQFAKWTKRHYFPLFFERVTQPEPVRALILMGPRRVGKTTMLHQVIAELIEQGSTCNHLMYVAIDAPVYNGLSLEQLMHMYFDAHGLDGSEGITIFFDEIQYLKDWEVHLKSLVDSYPKIKFVASGSAAAALKAASNESGAGRFTDFFLPPLTFVEFLDFTKVDFDGISTEERNKNLIDYVNHGGYPEAVLSQQIKSNPEVFIKNDIIDKVLLRDLPSLYGIKDIQELNRLFTLLAYNTGQEVSPKGLSEESGIAKNTITKYIQYLEAAFLIFRVNRLDRDAKSLKRITHFKVYLTNPSMRSALFGKVEDNDPDIGSVMETAVFSQWLHSPGFEQLYYARYSGKNPLEIDVVYKPHTRKAQWITEIKWSDKCFSDSTRIKGVIDFCKRHDGIRARVTTKTESGKKTIDGVDVTFTPTSDVAYYSGKNIFETMSVEDTNRIHYDFEATKR